MQGIYLDDGEVIVTQSMLKCFRRCPKQTQYKYVERLKPKSQGRPLTEGTWMHKLLEVMYKGGDWQEEHARLSETWGSLFDEEKLMLGNLPVDCNRLMKAYLWHYKHDPWIVHEVEYVIEARLPDGTILRIKVDLIVENEFGLWIVDHKFNAKLPSMVFRMLDAQSALYVWAARQSGIPVQGHIWNYVRRKAPSVPKMIKDKSRLSLASVDTEYVTYASAIKMYQRKYNLQITPNIYAELQYLKSLQYRHGEMQKSTFFRRDVMEKRAGTLKQVAREAVHTAKRMNSYDFDRVDFVERVPDRSCEFMCSYRDLCSLELFGGNTRSIRKSQFETVDPLYYYNDDPTDPNVREEQ